MERIIELVREFQPRLLIPGHYPFEIIDITDEETTAEYPGREVPYLRPEYSVETFAERLLGATARSSTLGWSCCAPARCSTSKPRSVGGEQGLV